MLVQNMPFVCVCVCVCVLIQITDGSPRTPLAAFSHISQRFLVLGICLVLFMCFQDVTVELFGFCALIQHVPVFVPPTVSCCSVFLGC